MDVEDLVHIVEVEDMEVMAVVDILLVLVEVAADSEVQEDLQVKLILVVDTHGTVEVAVAMEEQADQKVVAVEAKVVAEVHVEVVAVVMELVEQEVMHGEPMLLMEVMEQVAEVLFVGNSMKLDVVMAVMG